MKLSFYKKTNDKTKDVQLNTGFVDVGNRAENSQLTPFSVPVDVFAFMCRHSYYGYISYHVTNVM